MGDEPGDEEPEDGEEEEVYDGRPQVTYTEDAAYEAYKNAYKVLEELENHIRPEEEREAGDLLEGSEQARKALYDAKRAVNRRWRTYVQIHHDNVQMPRDPRKKLKRTTWENLARAEKIKAQDGAPPVSHHKLDGQRAQKDLKGVSGFDGDQIRPRLGGARGRGATHTMPDGTVMPGATHGAGPKAAKKQPGTKPLPDELLEAYQTTFNADYDRRNPRKTKKKKHTKRRLDRSSIPSLKNTLNFVRTQRMRIKLAKDLVDAREDGDKDKEAVAEDKLENFVREQMRGTDGLHPRTEQYRKVNLAIQANKDKFKANVTYKKPDPSKMRRLKPKAQRKAEKKKETADKKKTDEQERRRQLDEAAYGEEEAAPAAPAPVAAAPAPAAQNLDQRFFIELDDEDAGFDMRGVARMVEGDVYRGRGSAQAQGLIQKFMGENMRYHYVQKEGKASRQGHRFFAPGSRPQDQQQRYGWKVNDQLEPLYEAPNDEDMQDILLPQNQYKTPQQVDQFYRQNRMQRARYINIKATEGDQGLRGPYKPREAGEDEDAARILATFNPNAMRQSRKSRFIQTMFPDRPAAPRRGARERRQTRGRGMQIEYNDSHEIDLRPAHDAAVDLLDGTGPPPPGSLREITGKDAILQYLTDHNAEISVFCSDYMDLLKFLTDFMKMNDEKTNSRILLIVYEEGAACKGFGVCKKMKGRMDLDLLCADPGRGIGSLLLQRIEDITARLQLKKVVLTSGSDDATAFYRSRGYEDDEGGDMFKEVEGAPAVAAAVGMGNEQSMAQDEEEEDDKKEGEHFDTEAKVIVPEGSSLSDLSDKQKAMLRRFNELRILFQRGFDGANMNLAAIKSYCDMADGFSVDTETRVINRYLNFLLSQQEDGNDLYEEDGLAAWQVRLREMTDADKDIRLETPGGGLFPGEEDENATPGVRTVKIDHIIADARQTMERSKRTTDRLKLLLRQKEAAAAKK